MQQEIAVDWKTGMLNGQGVQISVRTLRQLSALFQNQGAASKLSPDLELYRVQVYSPAAEGTEGGLYWGTTHLQPGKVGNEYFMTKGHFHRIRNRAEYYATFHGEGALLLMGEDRVPRLRGDAPGLAALHPRMHSTPSCQCRETFPWCLPRAGPPMRDTTTRPSSGMDWLASDRARRTTCAGA